MNIKHQVLILLLVCSLVQAQGWISEDTEVNAATDGNNDIRKQTDSQYSFYNPNLIAENTEPEAVPSNQDKQQSQNNQEEKPSDRPSLDPFIGGRNNDKSNKKSMSVEEEQNFLYMRGKDNQMFRPNNRRRVGDQTTRMPMQHYDAAQENDQFELSQEMLFLIGIVLLGLLAIACVRKSRRHTYGNLRRMRGRRGFPADNQPQFVNAYPQPQIQLQSQPVYNPVENQIIYHKRELQRLEAYQNQQYNYAHSGRAMVNEYYEV